eukprot:GHVT01018380.1.p1 GENE.GHVT01018380.1~~GHVT01018380.1.p1  ORF type:complete len:544 (-),score=137.26 GHVT01018380.1:465-2096(-)
MAVSIVNAKADFLRSAAALAANCNAAKGLQEVLRSNLGPKGTVKMLVGGAGQVKVTKDGNVLLHEMQIQHPTASMIARASTAQDEITGDGTTSIVLFIGELMRLAERTANDGVHTRLLCEGFDLARKEALLVLNKIAVPISTTKDLPSRELLQSIARTSLRTKLPKAWADSLTTDVVDAVALIHKEGQPLDLFMVETLHMKNKLAEETRLIKGMVLDHGCRHPDMPRSLRNCFILTCNVSLEYEKTEINAGFFYSTAEQREKLAGSERRVTDAKVEQIIKLKQEVCTSENGRSFVLLNQKGIDPPSLDLLAKEGIMALRRVKRRNMERLTLCCGGNAVNSVDDLCAEDLGFAAHVYEQSIEEEKFTFIEGVTDASSCTILITGPNDHTVAQIKDAVRDGLRAVKNVIDDGKIVPGAAAFEVATYCHLQEFKKSVSGKARFGVEVFADSMLVVPKALAENSGLDPQECVLALVDAEQRRLAAGAAGTALVGLDIDTGNVICPVAEGIWDNYVVKRQLLSIAPTLAQQLLLVDEVIKAGKSMGRG